MTHELFSYDEADAILRLDGANDYVGISAIDGLIASVVAGPAAMEPSVWLPEVLEKPLCKRRERHSTASCGRSCIATTKSGRFWRNARTPIFHFHAGSRADLHRGLDD